MASVVVVDGHDISRAGLRSLLERLESVRVVGDASDARAALRLCATEQPRLAVVDGQLAGLDGGDLIAQLHCVSPRTKLIVISSERTTRAVIAAVQAGATAFLLKDCPRARCRRRSNEWWPARRSLTACWPAM